MSARLVLSLLVAVILLNAPATPAADEHHPAEELASFEIAEGFEVGLFASEKDGVINPIQIRFDPAGRLWVIISTVYPQLEPGQVPNDKVLVLEDTNGDGKCDKTTVFAEGLLIPTGIELGDGGVYLGHGTELLFLADTDGDLKADERRVIFRGFGTGDSHQNINSFLWGPGGELWFCQGLHTHSNVETPWGLVRMNQAGLWRFRPRLRKLEGFYGSHHEPQNPWGYIFTDWGEQIVIAGNNSSIIYGAPGLVSRYKPDAPPQIWNKGQGRKSSGADIVGTEHFPPGWQGVLITGGYINNAVWALDILEDGSGFALEDRPPLIKSRSRSFRPVDVKFGPDGSLYICDWYNPIIGHYQASFRHPDRDKTHGRIWRVTARGRPLTKPPQLSAASLESLLDFLQSPDRWTRHFAKRALADRPAQPVARAVQEWMRTPRSEHALKEALGVLQSHETIDEKLVRTLANASHPGARAYAASAVGRWNDRLGDPVSILRPLALDVHPRVRLHAIVASSYLDSLEALDVIAAASEMNADRFIEYALNQSVYALKPLWAKALRSGGLNLADNEPLLNLLLRTGHGSEVLDAVRSLLASNDRLDPAQRLALWRALVRGGTPKDLQMVLDLEDASLRDSLLVDVLESVRSRNLPLDPGIPELLRPLVLSHDPHALQLVGLWQLKQFRDEIEHAVSRGDHPVPVRLAAVEALGAFKDPAAATVLEALARDGEYPIRAAAIASLASFDLARAAGFARDASHTFSERSLWLPIFTAFLQRQGGAAALAKAFESKPPPPEVADTGLRIMNETGRRDEQLVAALNLSSAATARITLADLPQIVAEVHRRGDPRRGREVYQRPELGCVACHLVKGQGGLIGPDLSALGTAQPVDFIVGAILDPQKEVKEGYISLMVSTRDGDEFQGYLQRETPEQIVLKDLLQNEIISIPKNKIQLRNQSGSVMPAGLTDSLSRQEFIDLVSYLAELGK